MQVYPSLFRKMLFPVYESGLRGRKTLHYLRQYDRSQWDDAEQIQALQWRKLQALIQHCWEQVPYYSERWTGLGIEGPQDIRSREDYARLPVLQKPEIRANFEKLVASNHRDTMLYKVTGGSTGEPLRFGYTRESYERRLAVMWRGYGWAGARLGQRTLYLWGIPPGAQKRKERLYHAAFNRRMLSAFEMSESRMSAYADQIDRFRPETIVSYVSPIVKMAEWLIASGRRIHRPQRILGAAESLPERQRQVLEQAFGCPAYNTYGCREFMLIAAECEHRQGLHINADHLNVELGAPDGGQGPSDIILTDLHNYGMPLLRYQNGDLASASQRRCGCGRGLPMLNSVDGRKLDAIRTRDGRYVPGEFFVSTFMNFGSVRHYQVVQKQWDVLDIQLVRNDDFDEEVLRRIRQELGSVLGREVTLNFHFTDDIALTPSGKRRVTISELS